MRPTSQFGGHLDWGLRETRTLLLPVCLTCSVVSTSGTTLLILLPPWHSSRGTEGVRVSLHGPEHLAVHTSTWSGSHGCPRSCGISKKGSETSVGWALRLLQGWGRQQLGRAPWAKPDLTPSVAPVSDLAPLGTVF